MKCHRESRLVRMDANEGVEKKTWSCVPTAIDYEIAETTMGTPITA